MYKKLVNLTPHALNIFDEKGETLIVSLPPSGQIARVATSRVKMGETAEGIPLYKTEYGKVEGLPAREVELGTGFETLYIVSLLVRQAQPDDQDLASPGELIRDGQGQPIGCKGLNLS